MNRFLSLFFFSISFVAAAQDRTTNVLFAGQPYSFAILKIEAGDSIAYIGNNSDHLNKVKITGISGDTIFFAGGHIRVAEIKELSSSANRYKTKYLPPAKEVLVPPSSVYKSTATIRNFKDNLSNEMGFNGRFSKHVSSSYRKGTLPRMIYLEFLPAIELYRLSENQIITYSLPKTQEKHTVKVDRISRDSLFFDTLSFRLRQFSALESTSIRSSDNPGFHDRGRIVNLIYNKSDSANWNFIFPPDSIYQTGHTYRVFQRSLVRSIQRKHYLTLSNPLVYKHFIKLNLAKILHLELAGSYERIVNKRFGLETELSFGIGVKDFLYPGSDFIERPAYTYNSITITFNPRYYYLGNRYYFGPVVMYKYLWFNKSKSSFFGGDNISSYTDLQDEYRNDMGISLRVGRMKRNSHLVVDYYFGLGVKYVSLRINDYGYYTDGSHSGNFSWVHNDHTPISSKATYFMPVINAGIKLGRAF